MSPGVSDLHSEPDTPEEMEADKSTTTSAKIPRLNGTNFFDWIFGIEMLLIREDCWDVTSGEIPAPPESELPRLYREVEALRLHKQLDPKQFYRKEPGEGKGIKGLPKHFAVRPLPLPVPLPPLLPFLSKVGVSD